MKNYKVGDYVKHTWGTVGKIVKTTRHISDAGYVGVKRPNSDSIGIFSIDQLSLMKDFTDEDWIQMVLADESW
jgi:hypothetical protein